MQITFFPLEETKAAFRAEAFDGDDWGYFCQTLINYLENIHVPEFVATQWVDLVEMMTSDEEDIVEGIFYDGQLIGSTQKPFSRDYREYVKIEPYTG
jgi:hypothetical protein